MECAIGLYKTECIRTAVFHAGSYRSTGDVEFATAGWVDWYTINACQHPWDDEPSGIRTGPLRGSQPRAASRMGAAENLGRFMAFTP